MYFGEPAKRLSSKRNPLPPVNFVKDVFVDFGNLLTYCFINYLIGSASNNIWR